MIFSSAEDLDIVDCFLLFHEIREFPKKIQKPVTYFLELTHLPQSESAKALRSKGAPFLNRIPFPEDPLRYLKSLKAILKWALVGLCIY
ncbi:hypothetical protein HanIR_Chr06g0262751 [Helianthus annuus]|nr:hypothetical protein HanIR_Chr06g0262751 [Helianthus annuus]